MAIEDHLWEDLGKSGCKLDMKAKSLIIIPVLAGC
jgi:hypothetical protein